MGAGLHHQPYINHDLPRQGNPPSDSARAENALGMLEVLVIEFAGLSDAAKRAYILADNKLALNAGWDEAMLGLEVGELSALGVDLTLAGFRTANCRR